MASPRWYFRPQTPAERASDNPVQELFRATRSSQDAGVDAVSLIRETIQNSLDAAASQPVNVVMRILDVDSRSRVMRDLLAGLAPHVSAPENEAYRRPQDGLPCRILTIEDFGTTGLTGDTTRWKDPPLNVHQERFWSFWRNVGRGNRGENLRGRWGLGKSVLSMSSGIGCFFGLTIRADDGDGYLMGLGELRVHNVGDTRYDSYGYFGLAAAENLTLPVSDEQFISEFAALFRLGRRDHPGLSIVIPYVDDQIDSMSLIRAVHSEFFLPLLRNELIVTVAASGGERVLDARSVEAAAAEDPGQETLKLALDFSMDRVVTKIELSVPEAPPEWTATTVPAETKAQLKRAIELNNSVQVRMRVHVNRPGQTAELCDFVVLLKSTGQDRVTDPMYVRDGITVPQGGSSGIGGCTCLVVIEGNSLAELLGDSENPSHTGWKPNPRRFPGRWRYWKEMVSFVSRAPYEFARLLGRSQTRVDGPSLVDIFGIDTERTGPSTGGRQGQPDKRGDSVREPDIDLPKVRRRYEVGKIAGGFTVQQGSVPATPPYRLLFRVAYATRSGNPLSRWTKDDFVFPPSVGRSPSGVGIESEAAEVECKGNEIRVKVLRIPFKVQVSGFDDRRDLLVKPIRE